MSRETIADNDQSCNKCKFGRHGYVKAATNKRKEKPAERSASLW